MRRAQNSSSGAASSLIALRLFVAAHALLEAAAKGELRACLFLRLPPGPLAARQRSARGVGGGATHGHGEREGGKGGRKVRAVRA